MSAAAHYEAEIARREAELAELEEHRRKTEALANRPAELRDEIEELHRQQAEQVARAENVYLNSLAPYSEAREKAIRLVSELADALEQATQTRSELDAAWRVLINLGVEPSIARPERVDVAQALDRALHSEFVRLRTALGGRF